MNSLDSQFDLGSSHMAGMNAPTRIDKAWIKSEQEWLQPESEWVTSAREWIKSEEDDFDLIITNHLESTSANHSDSGCASFGSPSFPRGADQRASGALQHTVVRHHFPPTHPSSCSTHQPSHVVIQPSQSTYQPSQFSQVGQDRLWNHDCSSRPPCLWKAQEKEVFLDIAAYLQVPLETSTPRINIQPPQLVCAI